ncbi:RNA polymerase I specific transcription initiation factor RRN3 domain-containing protein [Ditylenchus destructor]|nr:RNA polymerase I specific transcription initiation factor RRN3 domain-containing protein [Ditylenchus destructor]
MVVVECSLCLPSSHFVNTDSVPLKQICGMTQKRIQTKSEGAKTGREIIEAYINVRPDSTEKYHKLHKALDLFESWSDESKIAYLEEFLELDHILDASCAELVAQFCRLKWWTVPQSIRGRFVDFLVSLAVGHVCHVEGVLKSVTHHFIPELIMSVRDEGKKGMTPLLSQEDQDAIYSLAHSCVKQVIACCPPFAPALLKCCKSNFPHFRHHSVKLLGYMRNMILLAQDYPPLSANIWTMIVDKLVALDTSISSKKPWEMENDAGFSPTQDVFMMDDDGETSSKAESSDSNTINMNTLDAKLDLCMAMVLSYIGGHDTENDIIGDLKDDRNFEWLYTKPIDHQNMFEVLLLGFEEHVLYAFDLHSVSYIWLYLCNLSKVNTEKMLRYLWEVIQAPVRSPNEWKKAHNAAAYLCGFLARASFVPLSDACVWLRRMSEWCCIYVDSCELMKREVGGMQHGTFYAVVQALLFVICYRHSELTTKYGAVEEIHQWGLGRIVHSKLEPLLYISQAVALCFANVSRYLQIVYCTHMIGFNDTLRKRAVELFFPFSFCLLNRCAPKILPLMRKFTSALEESSLTSTKCEQAKREEDTLMEDDEYDFMGSL